MTNGTTVHTTDYLDGFQYYNNNLEFFPTAEGYVKQTTLQGQMTFDYVFNYTDHLGNIRVSYTKDPHTGDIKILEENHYYPFGLKHQKYADFSGKIDAIDDETAKAVIPDDPNQNITPYRNYDYKYNSKEWQDELGLNMYDMDMRMYDPAIARWVVMDPVIHHSMSPYNAFDDNPVFWADPSGAESESNSTSSDTGSGVKAMGIPIESIAMTSNIVSYNFSDSYETTKTRTSTMTVGEDNPESLQNLPDGETVPEETRDYLSGASVRIYTSTTTTYHEGGADLIGLGISSFEETGKSMRNNAGKTMYGNNKYYFENKNTGRVFKGNQYTKVKSVSKIGSGIAKRAGLVGNLYSAGTIAVTAYNEGGFGHESQKATAGVLGGMAGAWAGAKVGAWVGAGIGSLFGGVGAIPGAVIGGAIGSVIGGVLGSEAAESGYESYSQ